MEKEVTSHPQAHGPFGSSAADRQRHMGLLTAEGKPDREILAGLSCIFAGQFFDDLCDSYPIRADVKAALSQLFDAAEYAEAKQKFLLICLQYDGIFRDLPDPVWWISGNPILAELFADGFLKHLKLLSEEAAP